MPSQGKQQLPKIARKEIEVITVKFSFITLQTGEQHDHHFLEVPHGGY
jgi:hypothetical protein